MTTPPLLDRIIIAAKYPERLAEFYGVLLGVGMPRIANYSPAMYELRIQGLILLFVSKEDVGIVSEQNLHQLRFVVEKVEPARQTAISIGGHPEGGIVEGSQGRTCCIRDPEGNSLELLEL